MKTVSEIKVKVWQEAEENIDSRYHIWRTGTKT